MASNKAFIGNVTVELNDDGHITITTPAEHDDKAAMLVIDKEPIGDRMWCMRKLAEAVLEQTVIVGEADIQAATHNMLNEGFNGVVNEHVKGSRFVRHYYHNGRNYKSVMDPEILEQVPMPMSEGVPTFDVPNVLGLTDPGNNPATLVVLGDGFNGSITRNYGDHIERHIIKNGVVDMLIGTPFLQDDAAAHGVGYVAQDPQPERRATDKPNVRTETLKLEVDTSSIDKYLRAPMKAGDFVPKHTYHSHTHGVVVFHYVDFTVAGEPQLVFYTSTGKLRITDAQVPEHFRREDN